jgi:hypothetical protein
VVVVATTPKRQASGGTSPGPSDACSLNAAWHEALDAVFRRVSE